MVIGSEEMAWPVGRSIGKRILVIAQSFCNLGHDIVIVVFPKQT